MFSPFRIWHLLPRSSRALSPLRGGGDTAFRIQQMFWGGSSMAMATTAGGASRSMSREEKKVIFASSLGTVFEWYDFYLYGSLAAIIAKQFFSGLDAGSAFIFALLAFAAGFIVRPFGAIF